MKKVYEGVGMMQSKVRSSDINLATADTLYVKCKKLTESELYVLMAVYLLEKPSMMEVMSVVNCKYKKQWKPQTVSTFLSRLVKGNYLIMLREGRSFVYSPIFTLEYLQEMLTKQFIEVCFYGDKLILSNLINDL